jgi:7,8-dihydroneopterin aldolase/epimerase/oxygenase
MTDTIFIKGLVIHARHGVMDHETEVGQRFVIDLELYSDLSESSRTDHLSDTVSYANVVTTAVSAFPRIRAVKVTVHKPHAPIAAIFEDVGVVLTRSRQPASND